MKNIWRFFDKFEDRVRERLSRYPIIYALLGGIAVVLFWRGTWHTADLLFQELALKMGAETELITFPWWDGPLSFAIGALALLAIGTFVSSFIGDELIITGLRRQKKLIICFTRNNTHEHYS